METNDGGVRFTGKGRRLMLSGRRLDIVGRLCCKLMAWQLFFIRSYRVLFLCGVACKLKIKFDKCYHRVLVISSREEQEKNISDYSVNDNCINTIKRFKTFAN